MHLDNIKWGIIGCGNVTELKSGPAFNKIKQNELVAVMRRDATKVEDYAKRHGVSRWYTDADKLIADPEVNAIYIATPPSTHAQYAIQAMRAGKPVYVEKPMALNTKECEEMLQVSQETGMPLFVAYYRRSLPGFLKVKEIIEQGTIGKPLFVNVRLCRPANESEISGQEWRVQTGISGGGVFHDLASHQLDYLDFLFGPIVEVAGKSTNRAGLYDADDTVVASFTHSSGVIGSGAWSFVTSLESRHDSIEIVGTKGRLVFSSFSHAPLQLYKDDKLTTIEYEVPDNIQFHLIQQVVDALRGVGQCDSTGASACRTSIILDKITDQF